MTNSAHIARSDIRSRTRQTEARVYYVDQCGVARTSSVSDRGTARRFARMLTADGCIVQAVR